MLNFDLMDTVAGQQIFDEGVVTGLGKGKLEDAREMVLEVLTERFMIVPPGIRDGVLSVEQHDMLKALLRQGIRCAGIEDFEAVLSKALAASVSDG